MKTRTIAFLGAVAVAAVTVGWVYATPIVGLATPLFSVGQHPSDINTHGAGVAANGEGFKVHLKTEGPATISIQDASYAAAGHTGWHSHPGMVVVTLISGEIQWFDENCQETDYKAGDSWTEGSQLHYFRVVSPTAIHASAVFITAQGVPARTDEAAPACAAALGIS